jgi:DNA-binding transcriptional ArsR family regulator
MAAQSAKAGAGVKERTIVTKTKRSSKSQPKPAAGKTTMAKALAHPTRLQILAAAHQGEISPSEFAKAHNMPTGTAAHHFKKLVECEAVELVREERVHGSIRHVYIGTKRAIYTDSELASLPESLQSGLVGAALQDFMEVAAQAIEAGTFTVRGDFIGTWDEAELDEIAWIKLGKMLRLVWKKVPSLEDESDARLKAGGGKALTAAVGLAAFELPWPKAKRSHREGKSHTKHRSTGRQKRIE